jgi:predicted ATPase
MLATIRKRILVRVASCAALGLVAFGGSSCATKHKEPLINDPSAKNDTALPWNEQQKWEREGEAGAMNQQRR